MKDDYIEVAARLADEIYYDYVDLGCTKVKYGKVMINGRDYFTIGFKGTDGTVKDWFRNFWLRSIRGIKAHASKAADRAYEMRPLNPGMPILVYGHSQGGSEALAFFARYCATADACCVAFAPAPVFKGKVELVDALYIINHRDVVPFAGGISFNHPICERRYYDKAGVQHDGWTWWQIVKDRWKGKRDGKELVSDHPMKGYRKVVTRMKD